jgi:hypothetical protein
MAPRTDDRFEPRPPPRRDAGPPRGIVLTPEQSKRRRQRNAAIGLAVAAFVLLIYLVTIVKLGPGVLNRPL